MSNASIPETIYRNAAAQRFADYIRRAAIEEAIKMMHEQWKENDWEHVADLCGNKKTPSNITRVLIYQKLREMLK